MIFLYLRLKGILCIFFNNLKILLKLFLIVVFIVFILYLRLFFLILVI